MQRRLRHSISAAHSVPRPLREFLPGPHVFGERRLEEALGVLLVLELEGE